MTTHPTSAGSRRRWPRRLGIGVLALVVLFHVGGGWYFADQIRRDGLRPEAPERNYGVTVVAVEDGVIALDSDDAGVDDPGQYALIWADGFGHLGDVVSITDGIVRRSIVLIAGAPPPLAPDQVDLDSWMYPTDPGEAGLDFVDDSYAGALGAMDAWYVPAASTPSETWAIHIHGWRVDRREAIRTLPVFAGAGVDSLVIEYRNDDGAPTDLSGLYRFGRTEWEDVEAAVRHAMDRGAEHIVLVGYSTGAAAAMSFVERSSLTDAVAGVIFDAPNIDFGRVVKSEAEDIKLVPGLPFTVPATLTASAMAIADLRFGIGWDDIDYVDRAADWSVPALVFHGDVDGTVPRSVSQDFADAQPELIQLVTIEGADHVRSWNVDPDRYETELVAFLGDL